VPHAFPVAAAYAGNACAGLGTAIISAPPTAIAATTAPKILKLICHLR